MHSSPSALGFGTLTSGRLDEQRDAMNGGLGRSFVFQLLEDPLTPLNHPEGHC